MKKYEKIKFVLNMVETASTTVAVASSLTSLTSFGTCFSDTAGTTSLTTRDF